MVNETPRGLRIARVSKDGPADRAGLRGFSFTRKLYQDPFGRRRVVLEEDRDAADYIVAIDGQPIATHDQFIAIMDGYAPGQRVVFTLLRDGQDGSVGRDARRGVSLGAADSAHSTRSPHFVKRDTLPPRFFWGGFELSRSAHRHVSPAR